MQVELSILPQDLQLFTLSEEGVCVCVCVCVHVVKVRINVSKCTLGNS